MSVLNRKLVRDLWRLKWQYFAVAFMIALGVAFYGAATTSYRNLSGSYEFSYDQLDFEDAGIAFEYAPSRVVSRIASIPGVTSAQGRLVEDVAVELPGRDGKKLIGRLVSLPSRGDPDVNKLRLIEGQAPSGGGTREVALEASFAKEHSLHRGDTVEVVSGTARVSLTVAGVVRSPEYIYVVRSKQDLFPMPGTFGVMFVREDVLGPLVGHTGQVNEIKVRFVKGVNVEPVLREMKSRLSSYRPDDVVLRQDQPSHELLQQDVEGFRLYAVMFPLFFLGVSAMTVYTLMTRTVHLQRPIIGLLRALGFERWRVVLHYLLSSLLVGVVGSLAGIALGVWLGVLLTRYYLSQIAVPFERIEAGLDVYIIGVLMGSLVCLTAAAWPANAAARVKPVETMRGVEPPAGRVLRLDRWLPGMGLLWRIPLRNLLRQWRRTASTLFGIVAGIALIMTGRGLFDSMALVMDTLMSSMFVDDLRVEFAQYEDPRVISTVRSWEGVVWAEGSLDIPVEFAHDGLTYSAGVAGVDPESRQRTVLDKEGRAIDMRQDGVVIGTTVEKRLGVRAGDLVQVSLPAFMRSGDTSRSVEVEVIAICDEPIGTVAYMNRNYLWRVFKEELDMPTGAVSGLRLQVNGERTEEVRRRLEALPEVGAVVSITEVRKMLDEIMARFRQYVDYMSIFGAALAFSIVFSTVTINVLERANEVATMRTLGVSRVEVGLMVTVENLALAVIGTVVGLPVGGWFVRQFVIAAQTEEQMELFSMKPALATGTYMLAATLILLVVLVSQWPALRMLNRLDLAKATKERST